MKPTRRSRVATALFTLFSILFMQYAMASYACPELAMGNADSVAMRSDMAGVGMSGCIGMDSAQAGLCHAHDQAGNQSLDKPELPQIQPFMAVALVTTLIPTDASWGATATLPEAASLAHATAPPLSILHCCFRI